MSKSITIEDYQFAQRIPKLAKKFKTTATEECDIFSFEFDNDLGSGNIVGMNFEYGMSFMSLDMKLKEETVFDYRLGRRHPVSFMYVIDGNVQLTTSQDDTVVELTNADAAIFAPAGKANYQLHFPAHKTVKLVICSVIRFLFLRKIECDLETMPQALREMFKDTTGKKQFIYTTGSNPLSFEISNFKLNSKEEVIEQKLLLESRTLKILTSLLKKFRVEKSQIISNYHFTTYDIQNINLAKNIIVDKIASVPTTKELSLMVGININKLQQGFHLIFGKSIRQFIISFRMHLALHLMDQGEKTISEIANDIGYINKGHFSSLFRKEFGILPRDYKSVTSRHIPTKAK